MINLFEFDDLSKMKEYKAETRRDLNLDIVRNLPEYEELMRMGVVDETSHQQNINNTLKLVPGWQRKEKGHQKVYYTIHPTGIVRRYNPPKENEDLEGSGNDIKVFSDKFRSPRDYRKALKYLITYFKNKIENEDYR
jgi:hypothetical protein